VLMAALAVYGALFGLLDVSMNACAARLELGYGRPIMSSLHAAFSIAGLAGAGIGGISAWLGIGLLLTFAATAVALIAGGLLLGPRLLLSASLGGDPPQPPAKPSRRVQLRVIWILGLLALCGQVGEGSAGDWSAVYLHANLGTSPGVAAVALAAFSVTMAAGRAVGDRLAARFGPVRLVRASGLVAGLGLAGGLLAGSVAGLRPVWPAAAIAGFALLGAGLAAIFPQIVTAAARLDPAQSGRTIGRIAAVAYSGLLSGPVVIGAIASGIGLRNALLVPAALALVTAATAGVMRPHTGPSLHSCDIPQAVPRVLRERRAVGDPCQWKSMPASAPRRPSPARPAPAVPASHLSPAGAVACPASPGCGSSARWRWCCATSATGSPTPGR
ncbi:MAG TPA: MFS transporter, partial [Streptosporangiaceae bacterium]